jgi:NitT/TauT family transport system substrate-binding protein
MAIGKVFALALLATLALQTSAHAQALEKPNITIAIAGTSSQIDYISFNVAQALGYFKDEGLQVDAPELGSGTKALQALIGGSADVDAGSYEHTIQMQAKGQSVKCLALYRQAVGTALGIAKSKADSFKSLKDLKGMTVGVSAPGNSSTYIFLTLVLARAGLQPSDVSVVGVGNGPIAVAAIRSGKIDAISTVDPALTVLTRSDDIKIAFDTRNEEGTKEIYGGKYASGCMMVKGDFAEKYPNTTQALVNATVRALLWIQKASLDQIMALLPSTVTGTDRDMYRAALENSFFTIAPDGLVSQEEVENVLKVVSKADENVAKATIDLSKTYDNSFAERALKKYRQ